MGSGVSSSTVFVTAIPLRLNKPKTTAKSERLLNDGYTLLRAINKLKEWEERNLS
jgi:hypothetical protein